ncbi:type II toxin-antitoxin system RelE/ParE family toxin [bacterium]|nr:MAG: type II toxin-antitoxin system RelE/ParE family toxin [bacterium]
MHGSESNVRIVLSDVAALEIRDVWLYNAVNRSVSQADRYVDALKARIQALSEDYGSGRVIEGHPPLRRITFRMKSQGAGHVLVYEVDSVLQTVNHLSTSSHRSRSGRATRRGEMVPYDAVLKRYLPPPTSKTALPFSMRRNRTPDACAAVVPPSVTASTDEAGM